MREKISLIDFEELITKKPPSAIHFITSEQHWRCNLKYSLLRMRFKATRIYISHIPDTIHLIGEDGDVGFGIVRSMWINKHSDTSATVTVVCGLDKKALNAEHTPDEKYQMYIRWDS